MSEEQDETCRATVEPLPADHERLKHRRWVEGFKDIDWKGGVRLTVPRKGGLGVDRYIVRCGVVVDKGEPRIFVCSDPDLVRLPDDDAQRIIHKYAAKLLPNLPPCGQDLAQQGTSQSREDA